MTPIDWLRKLWFEVLLRAPGIKGEQIGACRKFVPDPHDPILPNVYCRVCMYDRDLHRERGSYGKEVE